MASIKRYQTAGVPRMRPYPRRDSLLPMRQAQADELLGYGFIDNVVKANNALRKSRLISKTAKKLANINYGHDGVNAAAAFLNPASDIADALGYGIVDDLKKLNAAARKSKIASNTLSQLSKIDYKNDKINSGAQYLKPISEVLSSVGYGGVTYGGSSEISDAIAKSQIRKNVRANVRY